MKNKFILLCCTFILAAISYTTPAFSLSVADQKKYDFFSEKAPDQLSRVQKAILKELEIKKKAEEEANPSKASLTGKADGGMIGKAAKQAEDEICKACMNPYTNASGNTLESIWDQACDIYEANNSAECKADKARMAKACDMTQLLSKQMYDAIIRGENPEPGTDEHMTAAEMNTRLLAFKIAIKRIAEIRDASGEKSGQNIDEKAMDYTFDDLAGGKNYKPSAQQQEDALKILDNKQ